MRTAIPPIMDHADDLRHRLQREHNGHKKPRLQMLYLLASGQARTRQDVAHLLGVHRNTIGRWLAIYASGGLDALLATYVPAGKPLSLAPAVLASLEQALRCPAGFASYEALRRWVRQTHGVEVNYKTLYNIVRTRFRAKLKVPRPSHTKKAGGHR
jgi:transposase